MPETRKPARKQESAIDGRVRVVIESVSPAVDGGRFAAKRVIGDRVVVEADCFTDGHDAVAARVLYRREDESEWREGPMTFLGNDRWRGSFRAEALGQYRYTVTAWVDQFLSWLHDLERRVDPEDLKIAALVGAELIEGAAKRASGADRKQLADWAARLRASGKPEALKILGLDEALGEVAKRYPDRSLALTYPVEFPLVVDPERARYSTWYELFPRSTSPVAGKHGTFRDVEARLPYVAEMGFDVLYFPPIHPVGREKRKGKNNSLTPTPEDVGSPWAIGAAEGGHKSIHKPLGTIEDFRKVVAGARALGIDIALDIAFQCAPDHPYVKEHPEWFRSRPDGTVQYAENPPKKYQDIYPFNFEIGGMAGRCGRSSRASSSSGSPKGVTIFRVDNPHTKAFPFWEWAIDRLKRDASRDDLPRRGLHPPESHAPARQARATRSPTRISPGAIPRPSSPSTSPSSRKARVASISGRTCGRIRPISSPNTCSSAAAPRSWRDSRLQRRSPPSYGIYGPAYELLEAKPRDPGGEEYLDSEKYQLRAWDLDREDSLRGFIARINKARRENPALQSDRSLRFFPVDNEHLICYAKATEDLDNVVVSVVNLDPYHTQSGWVELDLEGAGRGPRVALPDERAADRGTLSLERAAQLREPGHCARAGADLPPAPESAYRTRFRLLPLKERRWTAM